MRKLSLLLFTFFIIGCSSEEYSSNEDILDKRKNFKTWEEFGENYLKLANNLSDYSNLSKIKIDKDETLSYLSPALNEILNDQNEFSIDNEIFWYHDGDFYSLGNDSSLKNNPKKLVKTNLISVSKKSNNNLLENTSNNQTQRFNLNHGSVDARYQKEFYRQSYYDCISTTNQGPTSRKVKFVHEIYNESFVTGAQYHNTLYLRIKLEWNPSGNKWRSAGEKRNININITDNSYLINGGQMVTTAVSQIGRPAGVPVGINQSFNCSNDRSILLRHFYTFGPAYSQWSVSVYGWINHEINGDIWSNKWENNVSW